MLLKQRNISAIAINTDHRWFENWSMFVDMYGVTQPEIGLNLPRFQSLTSEDGMRSLSSESSEDNRSVSSGRFYFVATIVFEKTVTGVLQRFMKHNDSALNNGYDSVCLLSLSHYEIEQI